ncbi:MAG TPA: hypothetical protein VKI61_11465, partial [Chitinophagaceae bacterium]|nr:hypothetical protein [Chitinophagaceae bacterium]
MTIPKNSIKSMRLFFIMMALFCMYTCPAQQGIRYDSSARAVRTFNPEKIKAYNADKDFQYNLYKEPAKSLWDRFWEWFWNKIEELLSSKNGSLAFKTVLILLAVVVICFFIYYLTGMHKGSLFKRNNGNVSGYSITDENIHSIHFEQAIDQAIANGNYRLAVRLLYLQTLKMLADKNVISWQLNK